jgi:hypothetical protein
MAHRSHESRINRFPLQRVAVAAALACGALLTACGGGGDSGSGSAATPMSQSDATADAANASATGSDTAAGLDAVIDTTSALAQSVAQSSASASPGRMQVESAAVETAPEAAAPVTNVTVNCAGGGTATLSITGGTAATELNGQLDAGEVYTVTYAQCTGGAGWAQLNGSVVMDVTAADHSTSPSSFSVNLTATNLALSLPSGSATLNGTATVSRSVSTSDGTTTTSSHLTVPSATLATAFNARTGSFTLTDLDATRTLSSVAGVATASQYAGHHTLSGTAWGRTFSMTVATNGNVGYDATGALVSGAWTVIRPKATIATTVANGLVVMTVDDGNDGTIDHTWTFPLAQLGSSAG